MLGEADAVRTMLEKEPTLAVRKGGPRNWEPLLYVCASRFHRESEGRAAGMVEIARSLLAQGASPDTFYLWEGDGKSKQSALYLATSESDNPALARVLLEAGASPNDGESIYHAAYHAAERFHLGCLDLLAEFGVNVSDRIQPWNNTPLYFILGHKPTQDAAKQVVDGVRWLLEHGADPNVSAYEFEGRPIHLAASNGWGVEVLELLWKHGADLKARRKEGKSPKANPGEHTLRPDPVGLTDGKTAYALAARYGHTHAMDWLREHGAQSELTPVEEFFAACGRGDEAAVRAMLDAKPGFIESLSDEEKAALAFAAGDGKVEAVRLMLLAGLPLTVTGDTGGSPLHQAAWYGQLAAVKLLIQHGASLEAKDATYGATPLGWACHGSENCRNPQGDYPGVVETLIQAGAKFEEAGGSEEVKAMMRKYGAK